MLDTELASESIPFRLHSRDAPDLRWRTASLVCAIFLTLIPIPFVLHSVFAGGPMVARNCFDSCGIHLVRVFQAAPLLGLFRTLARLGHRSATVAANPDALRKEMNSRHIVNWVRRPARRLPSDQFTV